MRPFGLSIASSTGYGKQSSNLGSSKPWIRMMLAIFKVLCRTALLTGKV